LAKTKEKNEDVRVAVRKGREKGQYDGEEEEDRRERASS
jgi:hypothetical protein